MAELQILLFGKGRRIGVAEVIGGESANEAPTGPADDVDAWKRLLKAAFKANRSRGAGHLRENLLACDFQLSCSELDAIGTLDTGLSAFGLDPRTFVAPEGFEDFHP